jgi:hypothetical protein
MMFPSLIPSMEYGENADASTEAVSIGGDLHQGLGDSTKQQSGLAIMPGDRPPHSGEQTGPIIEKRKMWGLGKLEFGDLFSEPLIESFKTDLVAGVLRSDRRRHDAQPEVSYTFYCCRTGEPVHLYFLPDDGALQRTYIATTGSACVTADCKKSARSPPRRFDRKSVSIRSN